MTQIKKLGGILSNRSVLTWIIAGSILLRIGAALWLGDQVVVTPGTADQISYHNLALRVLSGAGFSFDKDWWPATAAGSPTAHWSFLYTFYLVLVYAVFGIHPLAARIIQGVIVGILHPYLAYWIGKKCFGRRPGLFAAAISGGYIYFIYYAGCLMTEFFYIVAILGMFALVMSIVNPEKINEGQNWAKFAWLGLLFGCIVLLRQLFLIIIPFIAIWILWVKGRKNGWAIFLRLALAGGIVIVMILPFTIF